MSFTNETALIDAAGVLARRVGLRLDPSDRGRLASCVVAEAAAHGMTTHQYVARLDEDPEALQDLLNRVTVQESAFFRDPAQFDALAKHVLPGLAHPVTIWSAGCANGQEAYSVAMVLEELGYTDARVIATDISTRALDRARSGCYTAAEVKGVSDARRERSFVSVDGGYEVVPALRARVDVAHHNLAVDPPPFAVGECPVVLCRNVLIYFSRHEVEAFLDRLADWLPPDGWLFLGYSESLWQVTERFQLIRVGDAFVYQRRNKPSSKPRASTKRTAAPPRHPDRRPTQPGRDASRVAARPIPAPVASLPVDVVELLAVGEAAAQAGDHATAIASFRKCAYLDSGQPLAHFYLALALEASGDATAARRAYAAARAALDACETAAVEATLEGYRADELARLLDAKLELVR